MDCSPPGSRPWNSLGKNTGVGCHFFLQGIFQTQELSPGLPHCRQILYHLSHQGSPCLLGQCFCQFYRWKLNYSWPLRSMKVFLIFYGNLHFLKNLSPFSYWSMNIYICRIPNICIPVVLWLIHMQWGSCTLRILTPFSAINVKFVVWLLILFLAFWCIKFLCS